tara:strand:- start:486 stop:911 length:426 start_codon:yes stop_codon:yes gene_type:complete
MNNCNKTSDNKNFNCPAKMSDGRHFTDYRPNCYVNNLLRYNNKTMSNYDYRQFLINNGSELMKINSVYTEEKVGCSPCNATEIKNQTKCSYNKQNGVCEINDVNGVGLMNDATPGSVAPYSPNSLQFQELDDVNIGRVGGN